MNRSPQSIRLVFGRSSCPTGQFAGAMGASCLRGHIGVVDLVNLFESHLERLGLKCLRDGAHQAARTPLMLAEVVQPCANMMLGRMSTGFDG